MKPLDDRIALVTGASRGLGRGIALGLGEAGATVYVTGRTEHPGQASLPGTIGRTAAEITELGGRGIALRCDHRVDEEVEAVFTRIIEAHGRLDILVNNATALPEPGVLWSDRSFWEVPLGIWDDLIAVGLRSHYVATWFAAPIMTRQGGGLIVNVSSRGAVMKLGLVPYSVAKAALDRMTADTAEELRDFGVTVVSVWPPPTRTEAYHPDDEPLEPPLRTGRVVAALAASDNLIARSGRAFPILELARDLGVAQEPAGL